ncbi:hypothetical protein GALL_171790 [mine drainage metagenome]|uniref:Flagellar protein FliL n=1 Tax=mine drainage metagenome TaxID=410659 RepID=A0A1J5RXH4_9ZZZZ
MIARKTLLIGLGLSLLATSPVLAGEKRGRSNGPSNEISATVPANYIQLPRMRLTVAEDSTQQYRELELQAWITAKTPEETALLSSNKKKIAAAVKEDFLAYRWEAFSQPDTGMEIAKQVVSHAVQRAVGVTPSEVIMRELILH